MDKVNVYKVQQDVIGMALILIVTRILAIIIMFKTTEKRVQIVVVVIAQLAVALTTRTVVEINIARVQHVQ
jgi:hypothetical protein